MPKAHESPSSTFKYTPVLVFALISAALLVVIFASSGGNPSFEASNPVGQANVIQDADASGGEFVEFGEVATNPNGFPTEETTGFRGAGLTEADLVPYTGPTTINGNVTIENRKINSCIQVDENSTLTLRNSYVTSSSGCITLRVTEPGSSAVVEFTKLESTNQGPVGSGNAANIVGSNVTCRYCELRGAKDGINVGSNVLIEYSLVHEQQNISGAHNDGFQMRSGSNVTLRHNTIKAPYQDATNAVRGNSQAGPITNLVVENNFLSGGTFTVDIRDKGNGRPTGSFKNNVIESLSSLNYVNCLNNGGTFERCHTSCKMIITTLASENNSFSGGEFYHQDYNCSL